MNTARIVVLVIALGAGGVAAYLASGYDNKPAAPLPVAEKLSTVEVLVAKSDIQLGQAVKAEDLQWQTWPQATVSSSSSNVPGVPDRPSTTTVRSTFRRSGLPAISTSHQAPGAGESARMNVVA